jgi:hypothetical protein
MTNIIEGLSNLTMMPNEDIRDLLNRITDTMVIIRKLQHLPKQSHGTAAQPQQRRSLQQPKNTRIKGSAMRCNSSRCNCSGQLYSTNLNVVAQKDHTRITLEAMYNMATMKQRESSYMKVAAVETTDKPKSEENDVAAFQQRQN